jgi:pantoate--beta-alanine ligase
MLSTTTIDETRAAIAAARAARRTVALVPTMGFLHVGHLSLIDTARQAGADFVVVSIFVNPLQFGPSEDLERYPRDEKRDRELLEERKVDVVFIPTVQEMYPSGSSTKVKAADVGAPLEGERRVGHFDGVATVVAKLFNIVQPDIGVFGRKDAQQCAVISRMVADLDMPVRLVFGETVREHDGLAMSSRNSYLSGKERALAPALHRALRAGEEAIRHGVDEVHGVETLMRKIANETSGVEVDYLVVVDPMTFLPPRDFNRDVLLAGALRVGRTRLIDNVLVERSAIPHAKVDR